MKTGKQLSLFGRPGKRKLSTASRAKKRVRKIEGSTKVVIKKKITNVINNAVKRINKVVDQSIKIAAKKAKSQKKCSKTKS